MYKRQFLTNPNRVEKIWEESIERQPHRFWEPCSGDCINPDEYELPDDVREALDADPEWKNTTLAHYRIYEDDDEDKDLLEDRLFLFIDSEPVAVWITKY